MKRLGQPPIGYFYRRKGRDQRHRPIEDREGTIYWCYQIHGKRRAVCLHTEKIREALERVESMHWFGVLVYGFTPKALTDPSGSVWPVRAEKRPSDSSLRNSR